MDVVIQNGRSFTVGVHHKANPDDPSAVLVTSLLPGHTIVFDAAGLLYVTDPLGDYLPIDGKCYILTAGVDVNVHV